MIGRITDASAFTADERRRNRDFVVSQAMIRSFINKFGELIFSNPNW